MSLFALNRFGPWFGFRGSQEGHGATTRTGVIAGIALACIGVAYFFCRRATLPVVADELLPPVLAPSPLLAMRSPEENMNLVRLFGRLHDQSPARYPLLSNAEDIRTWMFIHRDVLQLETNLNLSHCGLNTLPNEIRFFTNLQLLMLDGNPLTALPNEIGNLTALRALRLSNTPLTALPDAIGNLTALRALHLRNTPLTALPDAIGNLTALQDLSLSNTSLTALPDAIGNLTALRTLFLGGTPLTTLPNEIGNLTALQVLSLSYTPLTSLPDAIGNLTALRALYLSNTPLTALPDAIGDLAQLVIVGNAALNRMLIELRATHVIHASPRALRPDEEEEIIPICCEKGPSMHLRKGS